jgi:hypothetical protein
VTRGRSALVLILVSAVAVAFPSSSARSDEAASSPIAATQPRSGRVVLFVLDRVSFEAAIAVPELRALSRAGGAALMASNQNHRTSGELYRAIATGAVVPAGDRGHLLREALPGVEVCFDIPPPSNRAVGMPGLTLAATRDGAAERCPSSEANLSPASVVVVSDAEIGTTSPGGRSVEAAVERLGGERTLVLVLAPVPSAQMTRAGDEVTPIFLAEGTSTSLFPPEGPEHALTSDTTRLDGLVSNVDVAPTIVRFFGLPVPDWMDGLPFRATDSPAPFGLHRLHLEQRRIRLPVQLGELAFVVALGLAGIACLLFLAVRGSVAQAVGAAIRFLSLCAVALLIVMLEGGLLPRLTYAVVVPYLVVSVLALALIAKWADRRFALGPFVFLGTVGLAAVVLDGLTGGRAYRLPLLGNTTFDGARFYGLGNSFIALVFASALFVATRMAPWKGSLLLIAMGLFVGFPQFGANAGGAVTLFAAGGMWCAVRTRGRIDLRLLGAMAAVLFGAVAVALANRFLPGAPTHLTRFVERSGGSLGFVLRTFARRLAFGFHALNRTPAGYIPLVGLLGVLWVVVKDQGPIGPALRSDPAWRDMLVVLVLAGVVAYFANDTGVAAAAPTFLYAMAALAYPVLQAAPGGDG